MRYAARPKLTGTGDAAAPAAKAGITSAPGLLARAEYRLGAHLSAQVQFVLEKLQRPDGSSIDAGHFVLGLVAGF